MSKKKIPKTNAIRLLEQQKISYTEQEYPWSEEHVDAMTTAQLLGQAPDEIFKTLVTVGNKTGPLVAVIPGNKELNLKGLAKISGNKKIEMLPLKDLEKTTGYLRGGCSPIGMKKLYPTYIDQSSLTKGIIHISAGKRGLQVSLKAEDLAKMVKGQFAQIAESLE